MSTRTAAGWAGLLTGRPLVMGILNVTPDSFSDGGRHATTAAAIAAAHAMLAAGADIIDIGGESTRPDAAAVPPEVEAARIVPVIAALAATGATISADTRNAATMAAALDAGAAIINDVSALAYDPQAAGLLATRHAKIILMHMRGTPATMNAHAVYHNLVEDVAAELAARRDAALAAGIAGHNIALDPGFGFAKLGAQNLDLLRATRHFAALGCPLVVGVSRKRFIGAFSGEPHAARRLGGSLAAGLYAVAQGAAILRVHDVAETVQALRVFTLLTRES